MLTREQNKRFTEVGPGTPMGELLRRYWLPFATVRQLHEHPTRAVTLLGEHLVAFRDRSGRYGLLQEHCPHRNANLLWGIPEPDGLRCPYHGWLFDRAGHCLDQPAEPPDSTFRERIQARSYPVEALGGLLYAWMGPEPRPMVPRWENHVRTDVVREIGWAVLPCNWLQIMENSMDPVHVEHLHSYFSNYVQERLGQIGPDAYLTWRERANVRRHVKIGFDIFEHGIIKRRVLEGRDETHADWRIGHCVVFPFMLLQQHIRVPMDDSHTLYWYYTVHPKLPDQPDQRPEDIPLHEMPLPGLEDGIPTWELLDSNSGQDDFSWMSPGPITPRWNEHLSGTDTGIILFRRLLRDQMRLVAEGRDPMNTFRDPTTNISIHMPGEADDPEWSGEAYRSLLRALTTRADASGELASIAIANFLVTF